jgi:hypothetical protein
MRNLNAFLSLKIDAFTLGNCAVMLMASSTTLHWIHALSMNNSLMLSQHA